MEAQRTPLELAEERGHELRDASPYPILLLGAALVVLAIGLHFGLFWVLRHFAQEAKKQDPPLTPLAAQGIPVPRPHLQATPVRDYLEYRIQQEAMLDSYGWLDKEQKLARIPIQRAMQLIVEKGLPRTATPPARAGESRSEAAQGATTAPRPKADGSGPATGLRTRRGATGAATSQSPARTDLPENEPRPPERGEAEP